MFIVSANSVQADDKAETRDLIEQLLKPLAQLLDRLSLKPETLSSIIHSPGEIFVKNFIY